MQISQDPIQGVYQSSDHFWERVVEAYEKGKDITWSERSKKSIQSRIQMIQKATKNMHACIKQCENRCPSGASNDDIFNQAKLMFREDSNFKGGWKCEHNWNIVKNFENFKDGVARPKRLSISLGSEYTSLESENLTNDSPMQASPNLSSSSLNYDEAIDGSPSPRSLGVKKSKLKRKIGDQTTSVINTLEEGNKQFLEQLKMASDQRQQQLEIESKNYALKEQKEENKILFCNLNTLHPNVRGYFEAEQARVIQKRNDKQQNQQAPPPSTSFGSFGQYFNDIGGSGSNLGEY
ncbi:hypothetical protein CARUB_v10024535mg [Capsella rubella]|uniref:No apical meristem-associated C-terminal domain-containing protein n=2 Tax=Capsella rubella TaxID=81985 RepID=R0HFB5_9BRAS|nr:hypothetical protein CARUB_v10024535mg [Capsella rubella]